MSRHLAISAYTPSNTDPQLLERIFVQRQRLLDKIVDRFARSMRTGDKHHILLVGPRGSGKTNLVSLAVYALRKRAELSNVMRIAWLGEDDTFASLIDIALGIADQLASEYPKEFAADYRTPVRGLPADEAAESILNSIIERLGQRNIVLIMENLDRIFSGLGDLGQKKWRAFLQEKTRIATLATSQQLFEGIASRDEAFFGFFDVQHLKPLAVDDARELIRKIGMEQGNQELIAFLDSAEGRYRVRSVHHLAGGNHRMYVLLAEFLTKESLDDLVDAFERLAEDLTPYFQERVRALSPQQAKIVQCLCNASGAMTVKQVAEDTFIAERNCSKHLGDLKQKGYVQSQKRGKESLYEMAEPLMRLCLEVKNQRGRPLKLVGKFLRAWFPESKLKDGLPQPSEALSRGDQYRISAMETDQIFKKQIREELNKEIQEYLTKQRYDKVRELGGELEYTDPLSAKLLKAEVAMLQQDHAECLASLTDIIDDFVSAPRHKAWALHKRGLAHHKQGNVEGELADYTSIINMTDAPAKQKAIALVNRGVTYQRQGNYERFVADNTAVIEMVDAPVEQRAQAFFNRSIAHLHQHRIEQAIADFTSIINMTDAPTENLGKAYLYRGMTHRQLGDIDNELLDYASVISMSNAPAAYKARALINQGFAYGKMGDTDQALANYSSVVNMSNAPAELKATALINCGVVYWHLGLYLPSQESFEAAISMADISLPLRTVAMFAVSEPMIANCSRDDAIAALKSAFREGDTKSDYYGGTPNDLLTMILRRGHLEWADYVATLVPLYVKYQSAAKLGQGVTQTISVLDQGGFSTTQLDIWNAAWQKSGKDCEELELPLRSLDAAIEAIKTHSDRPLFQLPLEIRELVRPLLTKSISS